MRRLPLALAFLALTASTGLAQKEFGFDNRKGSGQPYWKAEETVAKFKVAPEFEVKLFAGEPQLVNPIAFTIDEKGRVWCVESFEYPKRTPKGKAPRDRIVILEDTDGDGACDKRTVFAEGKDFPVTPERAKAGLGAFDMASGIEVGHGGVFVGAPPYLWFIENKSDKPGKIDVLLKGFGSEDTHETLNTFQWGPDGWLYGLHGIFTNSAVKPGQLDGPEARINGGIWRYHPVKKTFEIFAEGTSNPWGMDWRNTDGQFILACCVIPHLYHIVPGGIYKRQAVASFNPHVYGYLNEICDHTFHKESGWAHAGLISLDVPHMPEKYRNSVIFGSIHGCSIKQNILKPNGSTYTASRGDDFLVSGDKNFRPINMKWGPAGDIYLIDWHDQNPCHQTQPDLWDYERGRVYRIQLKGTQTKKAEDLGKLDIKGLYQKLESQDPFTWRTALRLLGEDKTGDKAGAPASAKWSRAQRAWAMNAFGQLSERFVANPGPAPTEEAVKALPTEFGLLVRMLLDTGFANEKSLAVFTAVATHHSSAVVRRELASAAIRLAEKHDVTPLLRALMSHKEDAKDPVIPQLVWLAYEKTLVTTKPRGADQPAPKDPPVADELNWLAEQSPKNEFVRDQIVPKVMRRLVATGKAADLKLCIEFVAKLKDVPSREKALDGLAIALAGRTVDMPDGWATLEPELRKDRVLLGFVNRLAVAFRDPAAIKRALAVATDPTFTNELRVDAIRQIGLLKPQEGARTLLKLIEEDKSAPVRAEAIRTAVAFDDNALPYGILRAWKSLSKDAQGDAVTTLASRKDWAMLLLQGLQQKTVDRAALTDNTILRIQSFNDAKLNKLIETAWGRSRPTPKELNDLIDKTRASLHEAPASFARGRAVFENTCGKCHKFDGKGADVGPALDGAGRDIEYLLGNVLDPNRVIGAPYFLRTARLLDGTVQQGVLAEEDDKFISLKLENGVVKKIAKADLEEPVKTVEKSLMPEGLGYNMTPQDFRDLVRYAMANPFITHVKINGEAKAFGVPGRITTPDTKGAPAVIEAEFTVPDDMKTVLLVGSTADFDVRLDGKPIGSGKGTGAKVAPDQASLEVTLPKGTHTLTIAAKQGNGVAFARFADPDRKLRYPDIGEKK
jgi:putative membrane-bound dehydrogenase-like protein